MDKRLLILPGLIAAMLLHAAFAPDLEVAMPPSPKEQAARAACDAQADKQFYLGLDENDEPNGIFYCL